MKIEWTQTFVDRTGKTITKKSADGKTDEVITLKELCLNALDSFDAESKVTPTEKYERYSIIKAINEGVDLTVTQVASIRKAIDTHPFLPFVHGQICDYLDQKEVNLKVVKGTYKSEEK